ncbi:MAG: Rne/Rng family ribonuclease [Clostridiales bacterium]|jgi:ribonuclease G|nr:Rne/Rng family ribonuclease [Clostridiales bacterium]
MQKEILVDIHPYQTRVALVENKELSEIYIERRHKQCMVGNIYKGRVQNILPGMQAAFVDIGLDKNAFLYAGDVYVDQSNFEFDGNGKAPPLDKGSIPDIKELLYPNQEIMVQVIKEPTGTKGARVTIHVTLPGRLLVLMPTVNYVGVSRRIEDTEGSERTRLKTLIEEIKPRTMGIIVRTAAVGKGAEDFKAELRFLCRLWDKIQQKCQSVKAPRLVHLEESLVFRTIRDIFDADIERMYINDRDYYEKAVALSNIVTPWLTKNIHYYDGEGELFDRYSLETKIDKSLARKVWLKNGSYLVFDQTEALTTVDVNTGKFVGNDSLQQTILETNLLAAKEIAKQLKLRDISGIIIIDFIDMEDEKHGEQVVETLREALRGDRTKTNVLGMTSLGLVEMTRRKIRQRVSDVMQSTCPYCDGVGKVYSEDTIALRVRKEIIKFARSRDDKVIVAHLNLSVAANILKKRDEDAGFLPSLGGRRMMLVGDEHVHRVQFTLEGAPDRETVLRKWPDAIEY